MRDVPVVSDIWVSQLVDSPQRSFLITHWSHIQVVEVSMELHQSSSPPSGWQLVGFCRVIFDLRWRFSHYCDCMVTYHIYWCHDILIIPHICNIHHCKKIMFQNTHIHFSWSQVLLPFLQQKCGIHWNLECSIFIRCYCLGLWNCGLFKLLIPVEGAVIGIFGAQVFI